MGVQRLRVCAFVCVFMLTGFLCLAENLVGYRVSTSCSADWNIAVNGTPFVRHRPTGFGRCIYSGSINRAVTNGWNTISLSSVRSSGALHKPEEGGCIALEITYAEAYRGQSDMGNVKTVLKYSGSATTNLLFSVDGEISNITGGAIMDARKPSLMASPLVMVVFGMYLVFINIYGYFMVLNDRNYAKKRLPRIGDSNFVWNAVLGGAVGQLISRVVKRHAADKTIVTVGIPMVLFLQIAAIVFLLTPYGKRVVSRTSGPHYRSAINSIFDNTSGFLNRLNRNDEGLEPK